MHWGLGWFLSLIGKIIVALQLYPVNDDLFRGWLFVLGAFAIGAAILECIYRIQSKKCTWKFPLKHDNKYEKELQ